MKKIAILLATYNGQDYIEEQLDSILQNIKKLDKNHYLVDIIVSDDSSGDLTINHIIEFKKNYPNIYILDSKKKGGALANFSFLLKNVDENYDIYFFSDQDDYWLPNKMLSFIEKFDVESEANEVPILVHSDLSIVSQDLFPLSHSMFNYQKLNKDASAYNLIVQNSITGCVMAINRSLLLKAKNSQIQNSIMHDWYIGIIASLFGKIYFIDKPTILYRQHAKNEVGAKKFNFSYIISKLSKFKENYKLALLSLERISQQAKLFIEDFGHELLPEQRRFIKMYASINTLSIYSRLKLFLEGFRKNGTVRNIFYIYFLIMRK
ncbi:MAG: glycosyltransferase family 2 protein [Actinobacillus minor]|nr:glycosyltransferase family 2 protein [Actinobacillus minor]